MTAPRPNLPTASERTTEILDLYRRYSVPTYRPSIALVKGKGARVWDADGKVYLDFLSGIAVTALGHAHPALLKALRAQAGTLMHCSNLFYNEPQARLAERLSTLSLGGKVFFCNSGAEANEGLIKLARKWGSTRGRYEVISFRNSFHGRTLATLTATGQEKIQHGFAPLPLGFRHAEFNHLDSVRAQLTGQTAAVLLEGIQAEGGVWPADPEFVRGLRQLCDEQGILLLLDEIQTGIGRTGSWFWYQQAGVQPDAFSLAKGLGGGFPIGAVVTSPALAEVFTPGSHGTTFGGNPLACAVALSVLDTIARDDLCGHAARMGDLFRRELEALVPRFACLRGVRGQGLLVGLVLDRPGTELQELLRHHGLLAVATGPDALRLLPPLIITPAEIRRAVRLIATACRAWLATRPPSLETPRP
jgi:predicted acetylornithine/succinylornithine family transaminase